MDISMPVMNGIEATRAILEKYPGIRIILLTQHDDLEYVRQAVKSGGLGYMLKNSQGKDFLEAIETVMQNKRYLSREIAEQIIDNTIRTDITGDSEPSLPLTRREVEIIRKIAEGKNNHTIAEELFISIRTVETHRRNLMQKLQLHSAVALVHYATRHGIIDIRNT
jgi:two-component system nitrate/nitrite response regulator NarL